MTGRDITRSPAPVGGNGWSDSTAQRDEPCGSCGGGGIEQGKYGPLDCVTCDGLGVVPTPVIERGIRG